MSSVSSHEATACLILSSVAPWVLLKASKKVEIAKYEIRIVGRVGHHSCLSQVLLEVSCIMKVAWLSSPNILG